MGCSGYSAAAAPAKVVVTAAVPARTRLKIRLRRGCMISPVVFLKESSVFDERLLARFTLHNRSIFGGCVRLCKRKNFNKIFLFGIQSRPAWFFSQDRHPPHAPILPLNNRP